MNLAQNKFLIGFAAVMLVGGGSVGYLLQSSYSKYGELSERYEWLSSNLTRLESAPLYPESANLAKLDEKKRAAAAAVQSLHQQLVPLSFPLEAMTPEQFQDKLRVAVSATVEKSKTFGVKLPETFYLGFDNYRTQPPKADAASVLGRQLKAVELAVNTLIENKVDAIAAVTRKLLAEEDDLSKTAVATPVKSGLASKAKAIDTPLVAKFPFEIQFTAEQTRFRSGLNALIKNDKQFFIVRPLLIKNENDKPLSRAEANPPPKNQAGSSVNPGDPGATVPVATPEDAVLRYIVGTEKINVGLRVDMVVFAGSIPK